MYTYIYKYVCMFRVIDFLFPGNFKRKVDGFVLPNQRVFHWAATLDYVLKVNRQLMSLPSRAVVRIVLRIGEAFAFVGVPTT